MIGIITSLHNAKEYKNNAIIKYCEENGIYKIYSPPYNPENNGIAERFNQTLISCTKTILYWSKLSENFWDYAILYANYLYNKTPHQIAKNNIPDETFYGYKVKLDHIRTFGCIAYYKDYNQNKSKITKISLKGVFLGFSESTNSYIIMDYFNYKIHYSSEIECLEDDPASLSLSNSVKKNNDYTSFFKFDFNFSKIEKLNDYFFINQNINNSQNSNNQYNEINDENNDDSNINHNNNDKDNNREDKDKNNDSNNNNNNNNPEKENDNESYYSAEENSSENNSENSENNFNNKNLSNFEENLNFSQNNNLSSKSSFNNNKNNNNLSSEKLNFSNSIEQNNNNLNLKDLNSNNLKVQNNNNLNLNKNLSSKNYILENNTDQTLMDIVSDNDMNLDNNNNIFSNYNQYMGNISNNNTNNILNKSNLNNNSNFNSNEYNNNIHNDDNIEEEVIENQNINNNFANTSKGRKTLIINNKFKIPQEYSVIRNALQRKRYAKLNKNPFNKSNFAVVKTRKYKKRPLNIKF